MSRCFFLSKITLKVGSVYHIPVLHHPQRTCIYLIEKTHRGKESDSSNLMPSLTGKPCEEICSTIVINRMMGTMESGLSNVNVPKPPEGLLKGLQGPPLNVLTRLIWSASCDFCISNKFHVMLTLLAGD